MCQVRLPCKAASTLQVDCDSTAFIMGGGGGGGWNWWWVWFLKTGLNICPCRRQRPYATISLSSLGSRKRVMETNVLRFVRISVHWFLINSVWFSRHPLPTPPQSTSRPSDGGGTRVDFCGCFCSRLELAITIAMPTGLTAETYVVATRLKLRHGQANIIGEHVGQ